MGLLILVAGLAIFFATHTLATLRPARAAVIDRLGGGYWVIFSALSITGLVLAAWGFAYYRQSGWIEVWQPPAGMRHLALLLAWPAAVLVSAAYLPGGHIKRVTRHPMLAGVKLWALAHLLANGDLGSIILFGSFLGWAVYDRITVKRREAAGAGIVKSAPARPAVNDAVAVVIGTLLYLVLVLAFHPLVIGVPVVGR
jgi:uncharacterized membrane protein